jgi:hypothetical protein
VKGISFSRRAHRKACIPPHARRYNPFELHHALTAYQLLVTGHIRERTRQVILAGHHAAKVAGMNLTSVELLTLSTVRFQGMGRKVYRRARTISGNRTPQSGGTSLGKNCAYDFIYRTQSRCRTITNLLRTWHCLKKVRRLQTRPTDLEIRHQRAKHDSWPQLRHLHHCDL